MQLKYSRRFISYMISAIPAKIKRILILLLAVSLSKPSFTYIAID